MVSNIFNLKEAVLRKIPRGELPWQVFGRLMLKTGFPWANIKEDIEVSPQQFNSALRAVEDIFGKSFLSKGG